MNRRWLISRKNPEYIRHLSGAASISPVLAHVLINRGIKTPSDVKDFLLQGVTDLSDPFDLPAMASALERIKAAVKRSERVLVHGDYDTDGLTATAIMVQALTKIGLDVHSHIPNRLTHGYGFNPPSIERAKELGVSLIITVDCGITSFDAAAAARQRGIDVIITDHHEPAEDSSRVNGPGGFLLPDAVAVVNPKLGAVASKLRTLSGAGVAFKVVQAMATDGAFAIDSDDSLSLLDLAAVGTLADVVPLLGENRIIMKEGLRYIREACRPGIRSLMEVSGLREKELRAGLLSFTLVPRINASGRMGDAGEVVSLFLSGSYEETLPIAEKLDRMNSERQRIEEETYQEALSLLRQRGYDAAIVLCREAWHTGVIGIVASRLAEDFCRPAFVFTQEGDTAKGSVRSIPAFDVYTGLSACSDVLLSFGGHRQAAGVRLRVADLPLFEARMNELVRNSLRAEDFVRTVEIDSELTLREVNTGLVRELSLLEPVGAGNPEPLFGARGLDMLNPKIVGKNHLKMRLKQKSLAIDAIGFDMGSFLDHLAASRFVDAVFTPKINEWNGNKYLQLNLRACRPGS
ncbi:MAG: single-stranded-DNA-specific exonuclease RecJ [Nitrospirae bacterium]|nr:single-stranded-DNA-specific exonuclease RecJ [Nitrospirota bacterium]